MNFLVRDRSGDVLRAMRQLADRVVLVGIPSSTAGREDVPITNAVIGYIQEHGSPAANIPARPFLVPGVEDAEARTIPRLKAAATAALAGDAEKVDQRLHQAGLIAQSAVQAKINSNVPPPLAESTLEARRARGRTGERTLVDTGQLRNSITYVLRRRKG
jgi:phage gpG-like protein